MRGQRTEIGQVYFALIKIDKQKMDAKVKVLQSTALYELLAEKDPELASMLTAYKELTKKEDMNHV